MTDLPIHINLLFVLTTLATFIFVFFLVKQAQSNKSDNTALSVAVFLGSWLFFIAILALNEFFLDWESMPPRFLIIIGPPLITVLVLIFNAKSRAYLLRMPITGLTYLHIVRVPVEIVLWWLALADMLPLLLTFEGINHDILSGVSAPFVAIFMVGQRSKSRIGAIIWNMLALGLLINIVYHAILATPYPFQQYGLDQPNKAVFYFPFVWLPGFIVPAVLFSHLIGLMKLFVKTDDIE